MTHLEITDIGPNLVCLAWVTGRPSGLIEEFADIAMNIDRGR
ncbi:MAG TPA: hypothetical protein VGD53_06415 [Actinoallomurus sp.]